jgi:SAM-dependent methyltransferase
MWGSALLEWRIPEEIEAQAPESPWGFPPALFGSHDVSDCALHTTARSLLPARGVVLDVGCGGGAASIPLARHAGALIGVDESVVLLRAYSEAARAAGAVHTTVLGRWPDVERNVKVADVVVCRNVVYNVPAVAPFVEALTGHARDGVVVELTATHPSVPIAPLWRHFWDLERPDGPDADLFIRVLRERGYAPEVEYEDRPMFKAHLGDPEYVSFVRRRLCLPASRDAEVAEQIAALSPAGTTTTAVTVTWVPASGVINHRNGG